MLYTLNVHNVLCQLYISIKLGGDLKEKEYMLKHIGNHQGNDKPILESWTKYFLPAWDLPFDLLKGVFWWRKVVNFNQLQWIHFFFSSTLPPYLRNAGLTKAMTIASNSPHSSPSSISNHSCAQSGAESRLVGFHMIASHASTMCWKSFLSPLNCSGAFAV